MGVRFASVIRRVNEKASRLMGKRSPARIAMASVVAAATIVLLGLVFANPENCPANSTQAQVDATGCNVGANIGLGLLFLLALLVALCGVILAVVEARSRRMPAPPQQPRSVEQPPPPA